MDSPEQISSKKPIAQQFEIVVETGGEGHQCAIQNNPVELLAQRTGLGKALIKDAMNKGALWHQSIGKPRRLRRKSAKIAVGDKLFFYFDQLQLKKQPLQPVLVESHQNFSVWDKPAGMPMLGSKWCDHTSLERWVSVNHLGGGAVHLVHRLDRWTSGLVLMAHSKKAASELAEQFASRQVLKCYRALSVDRPASSKLIDAKLPLMIDTPIEGKSAKTIVQAVKPATALLNIYQGQDFDALAQPGEYDLKGVWQIDIEIQTGRKHQVRKHLAGVGLHVLGDRQYGDGQESNDLMPDLQLRAVRLSLNYQGETYDWHLSND